MGRVKGKPDYSKEQVAEILEAYARLKSCKKVEDFLGVPDSTVSDILKKNGVSTANPRCHNKGPKTCTKYLEKVVDNDLHLGYIAGIMATDGWLTRDRKEINLSLACPDMTVLKFFSESLSTPPLKIRIREVTGIKKHPSGVIKASLPILYDFLVELGITSAKSYTLNVNLDGRSENFCWGFLRGAIDGDGSVFTSGTLGTSHIRVASASLNFAETLKRVFGGTIYVRKNKPRPLVLKMQGTTDLYIWGVTGRYAQKIASRLPLASFMIERKTKGLQMMLSITGHKKQPVYRCVNGEMFKSWAV